mmetsp:Transcript_30358/g.71594  ORF Transcript_30358/g.71594 Transcript_30358/m.71594 type:complete len:308 (-) Transcript_30358:1605-2528(-)
MPVEDCVLGNGRKGRILVLEGRQKRIGGLVNHHIGIAGQVFHASGAVGVSEDNDLAPGSGWFHGFFLCHHGSIGEGKGSALGKILDDRQGLHRMTESSFLEGRDVALANGLDQLVSQAAGTVGFLHDVSDTGNAVRHGRRVHLDPAVPVSVAFDLPNGCAVAREGVVVNGINVSSTFNFSVQLRGLDRPTLVAVGQPIRRRRIFVSSVVCGSPVIVVVSKIVAVVAVSPLPLVPNVLVEKVSLPFPAVAPFGSHCHVLEFVNPVSWADSRDAVPKRGPQPQPKSLRPVYIDWCLGALSLRILAHQTQ